MSKNYAFFPSIIQHPKLTGHVQFMSDFSFRHLVYHVSPDWWCCCPFTSRSSRRIDFTEKETLYSKTSWDPGEISLLQVRETYKSSQKSSQNLFVTQEKFCIIIRLSTWGLQKISSHFFSSAVYLFFYTTMVWFVVSVGSDMNGKRRGEVSFLFWFQFWTSCLFNFHQVLQTLWQFLQFKNFTFSLLFTLFASIFIHF